MPVPVLEAASAEVGSSVNNVIMTRNADMILVLSVFKVGSSLLSFRDNEEADRFFSVCFTLMLFDYLAAGVSTQLME